MQSYRSNADNPWNLFISGGVVKTSASKFDEAKSSSYILENVLSSSLPVSFTRCHDVVHCDICKVLIIKNRFKQHYENRHRANGSTNAMIPFEEEMIIRDDNSYKIKKIKRNRKKSTNVKEKIKYPVELLEKKKSKKVKIRPVNKRHHSKSFLDCNTYFGKMKKLKLDDKLILKERQGYFVADEGFMSSSPKQLEDNFYCDNVIKRNNLSLDILSLHDGVYCSNDSVNRTSSDSSTPPSLSLGTLHSVSSPSSLNILNDPSSVVTEHYFLTSNDLTPERSTGSCKYQIESLPWENFPSISNDTMQPGDVSRDIVMDVDEDGEVERAVQSITNLCDGFQSDILAQKPLYYQGLPPITDDFHSKSDTFNSEDASIIDSFLDEVLGSSASIKDQFVEFGACSANVLPNIGSQNTLLDDCNQLIEYQLDSNLITSFSNDYDEKFETLINNAMNEFVTQSPRNICSTNLSIDKNKSHDGFDPLKHCGVVAANGIMCHRSLLCKLHTMSQKRQVQRSESLTLLIKEIRDSNKANRVLKKQAQSSNAFKSCNSSKTSNDSFSFNCSSARSTEEINSLMELGGLSTPDLDMSVINYNTDTVAQPLISSNTLDPKPLVTPRFQQEIVVNGNRSLMAMKSLLWRNRPKSHHGSSRQVQTKTKTNLIHGLLARDMAAAASFSTNHNLSIKTARENTSQYGLSCLTNDISRATRTNHNTGLSNVTNQVLSRVQSNTMTYVQPDAQRTPLNIFVSGNDLSHSSNSVTNMSPRFLAGSSTSQLLNINPQFINTNDQNLSNHTSLSSELLSSSNKFISIVDDGLNTGSLLYPVRNTNQIMMVVNNDSNTDLFNDNYNQMSLNSFLALKQNNNIHPDGPQLVSISPLELQRLSDNSFNSAIGGQYLSTENDKTNSLIYHLNTQQQQPTLSSSSSSSSLPTKIESNNMAKPLTVQSSSLNGLTQKFVILPDGTISAFTEQPSNPKTGYNHTQTMNTGSAVQQPYPVFNQLPGYSQNQTYFINNDNIIIGPNSGSIAQQLIMPQIINQADLNGHSSTALAFIQPQNPKISKIHNNRTAQIPVDLSQQNVSFQIQTQNQYQNQIPNTFFITSTHPNVGAHIPLKQQIFVQSNEHLSQDISLMDSSDFYERQCNGPTKSMDSDIRTISSTSSSQDYEFVNHVLNPPQSLIIQQSAHTNRFNGNDSSQCTLLNNGQQHIIVNNTTNSNEQFAQSQIKNLSHGAPISSSPYINVQSSQSTYKSIPPPLVISQQLMMNQSLANPPRQKILTHSSYQQQYQPKTSQGNQLVMDDSQFSNEYMIVQSLIA